MKQLLASDAIGLGWNRARILALLIPFGFLVLPCSIAAAQLSSTEYDIKAAYLYHFLNFIRWPANSPMHNAKEVNVCVLGENPFGNKLDVLSRRAADGKAVSVYLINESHEVDQCHMVFIPGRRRPFSDNILRKLVEKQILSVGENEYFVKAGGMVALTYNKGRISCLINLKAGRDAGFQISAPLLEVSTIVVDDYR